jgi:hypothetical protein
VTRNVVKMAGIFAFGIGSVMTTNSSVYGGLFGFRSVHRPVVIVVPAPPLPARTTPQPKPVRQVRAIYFSAQYSAWFEVDGLVSPEDAEIGVLVTLDIPNVGQVRGWVVSVYSQPRMVPPYETRTQESARQPAMIDSASSLHSNVYDVHVPTNSRVSEKLRLWTNRAGTRQALGEFVELRGDTVVIRGASGEICEDLMTNFSDADMAFIRSIRSSQ